MDGGRGPPAGSPLGPDRQRRRQRPRALVGGRAGPRVSLAHHGATAVATAGGRTAGIDVEVIEPRGTVFARLALTGPGLPWGPATIRTNGSPACGR